MAKFEWCLGEVMARKHVTNKALAKLLEWSPRSGAVRVSQLKRKPPRVIRVDVLCDLCRVLECELSDLMKLKCIEDEES